MEENPTAGLEMKPVSPVLPRSKCDEVVYAKDQPEYMPLPAVVSGDGLAIVTRWRLRWWERLWVLVTGHVYLWVGNFGQPPMPVLIQVEQPVCDPQPVAVVER